MFDSSKLYYTKMSEECFQELKLAAIELWKEIDTDNDAYGYATGKISKIKDLENISDNGMYMVAMFDWHNQGLLAGKISEVTKKEIAERMSAGGTPMLYNPFL